MYYFSHHLNREVKEVFWHSLLSGLALSLVFIFEPIYLYSLGYSLPRILWFYAMVYVWYMLLVSLGAKFASHYGYKHSILVSNIFYVIYWIVLFSVKASPMMFFVAPVFFALQKSWFWPAYDAELSLSSARTERGREVGVQQSLLQIGFIAGPIIGGALSQKFGFLALFITAATVLMVSVYPLFKSPEVYSQHEFKLKNLWTMFRRYPRNFFGYFGYAEDMMVMSLWPIYMFMVVPSFFEIGTISTVATLLGTVIMLYMGRLTDRADKHSLIRWSAVLYGLTWIFRFAGSGIGGVLGFDIATKTGKNILNVPMLALTFERAGGRGGDQAIAYSVFYEFSLSFVKILMCLAAIAILGAGGSILWVFALAGVLTLFYGFLK